MAERLTSKRVRTGCMTCRKRRRKCDEQKPNCINCRSKGLTCQYGSKLTFVASKFQHLPGDLTNRSPKSRETIQDRSPSESSSFQGIAEDPPLPNGLFTGSEGSSQPVDAGVNSGPLSQTGYCAAATVQEGQRNDRSRSLAFDAPNTRRRAYELDLLTYYRYHVAPVLDLDLGSLCFGVQLLLDSKASEAVHHAILAVASSQRASTRSFDEQLDQATSITSEYLARDETEARHGTFAMPKALLLWKDLCLTPMEDWFSMTPHVLHHARQSTSILEHWLLLSRLHCAASLNTPLGGSDIGSFPPLQQSTMDGKVHPALSQLGRSLWMLEKTLFLLLYDGRLSNGPGVPNAQEWRFQWHELQQWYSRRIDEMRQIFEVTGDEVLRFEQQDNIDFPYVVYSNACATVANVAHHTASYMLLQHKPRLIKPVAQTSSSISSMWHAHRVIGIVSAAAGAGIWDPFITATLAYCSRKLSNATQIRSVVDTMKLIQMRSGLKLEKAISDLEELAKDS